MSGVLSPPSHKDQPSLRFNSPTCGRDPGQPASSADAGTRISRRSPNKLILIHFHLNRLPQRDKAISAR